MPCSSLAGAEDRQATHSDDQRQHRWQTHEHRIQRRHHLALPALASFNVGLHLRIGDSGEKIESSTASARVMTRFCGVRRPRRECCARVLDADSGGSGCVSYHGPGPRGPRPASTASDVFLPRILRREVGIHLATFPKDHLKKATALERVGHPVAGLRPVQRRGAPRCRAQEPRTPSASVPGDWPDFHVGTG